MKTMITLIFLTMTMALNSCVSDSSKKSSSSSSSTSSTSGTISGSVK